MKIRSTVVKDSVYNGLGALVPMLLSLVTIPVYFGLVGAERFGVLSIAWLLLGYFGVFDLGLGRATAQRIAAQRQATSAERARTFWNAIAVNLSVGILGALFLWFVGEWYFEDTLSAEATLRNEIKRAIPLLALCVPVTTLMGVLVGTLQGRELFLQTNLISTTSTILFQVFPILVAWLYGPDLLWLLAASLAARVLAVVALWLRCRSEVTRGHPIGIDRPGMQSLLQFGGWITISALVSPLMTMTDRFAIGAVLGAAAVAAYTIPFQLAQRTTVFPNAIANAVFPRLASNSHSLSAEELSRKAGLIVTALMTPAILVGILLMGPFLHIWLGGELPASSTLVGQVALIGFWLNGLAYVPFALLHAQSRPKSTALLHITELAPYIGALYLLTLSFGLVGAAAAFALRCGADYLAMSSMAYGRRPGVGLAALLTIALVGIVACSHLASGLYLYISLLALSSIVIACSGLAIPVEIRSKCWAAVSSRLSRKARSEA